MPLSRRDWLRFAVLGSLSSEMARWASGSEPARGNSPIKITGLKVTPIALPDPPILAAGGCHGPYFLRNIVEMTTDAGIVGIGETRGGEDVTLALEKCRKVIEGRNAFAYRAFFQYIYSLSPGAWAAIELACLDACGKATGRRACELLGGPVRDDVEFAAYLFYRFAADHPKLLADPRIVDGRGRGDKALDDWGEVRSAESMVREAVRFHEAWGFRVFKLKAGVLPPDVEQETMQAMHERFGGERLMRIDPNARWTTETAIRVGRKLRDVKLEYYEDPVRGQEAMAEIREATNLPMSTNMCVTRFEHVPRAVRLHPVDVVLADNHYWGGLTGCQELGRVCETLGWKVSQHSNSHAGVTMAAMIHLAAVVPQLTMASDTHYPWLVESADIIAGGKLPIRDGRMKIPDGPGLGVKLDHDKLARAHETYRKCGMRNRDDATTMRMVDPTFDRNQLF
jgi:glucarate dehydratase